jgi:tetratricopeptide (TPR) repeat protein
MKETVPTLMARAIAAYSRGAVTEAEHDYREVLNQGFHPNASLLLANLLLGGGGGSDSRSTEALALAKAAVAGASACKPAKAQLLYARHGQFLLQFAGYEPIGEGSSGNTPQLRDVGAMTSAERKGHLEAAIASLNRAVALNAAHPPSWMHLSLACAKADRHLEAAAAARGLIASYGAGQPKPSPRTLMPSSSPRPPPLGEQSCRCFGSKWPSRPTEKAEGAAAARLRRSPRRNFPQICGGGWRTW